MLPHDYRNPALLQDRCLPLFAGKQQRHRHHGPSEFSLGNLSFTRGATEKKFGSSALQCWEAGPISDLLQCTAGLPKWASQCGPGSRMGTGNSPPAADTKLRYGHSNVPFPTAKGRAWLLSSPRARAPAHGATPEQDSGQAASRGYRGLHSSPRKSPRRGSVSSRNFRGCSEQVKAALHLLRSSF